MLKEEHLQKDKAVTLKPPVSKGTNPRRVSFAARFAGMKGPMKDSKGRPTRKALALKKWGFGSVEAARNFAKRHKKKKIDMSLYRNINKRKKSRYK